MINFYIIYPYRDSRLQRRFLIDKSNIASAIMRTAKSEPYQLNLTISPASKLYDTILDTGTGIRVDFGDISIAFVRKKGGNNAAQRLDGLVELKYLSEDVDLENLGLNPRKLAWGQEWNDTLGALLTSLSDRYYFRQVGADRNLKFSTGALNNLQLLRRACDFRNVQFRNNGIVDAGDGERTEILVGDFTEMPIKFKINNLVRSPNPFDKSALRLKDIDINYSGEVLTGVLPFVNTGGGFDPSSATFLTDPGATFIDPDYPLVASSVQTSGGETIYEVSAPVSSPSRRVEVYEHLAVSNSEDGGVATVDLEISKEQLYERAVNFLKSKSENINYSLDIEYNSVVLPLEKIDVNIRKVLDFDGAKKKVEVRGEYYSDSYEFDLSKIS